MKKKLFPWIIALSALAVSGSAAFYSVSGLGKMFAGASLQVMVLAGSLEFAKLVTASLLYQYWSSLNKLLKVYLSIATLILILITSAGIYGFLSAAYQETAFKVQNQDKNIEILDKNISIIKTEISNYESQVKQKNDRVSQLTTIRTNLQSTQDVLIEKGKSTNAVRQQIKDVDSEIKRVDSEVSALNDSISSKNSRISLIETNKLDVSSDSDLAKEVGPLKYIAELTGKGLAEIVNWYIIVLMLVFDPLAIALVIAANFAFQKSKEDEDVETNTGNKIIEEDKENKKGEMKDIAKKIWGSLTKFTKRKNKPTEEANRDSIVEEALTNKKESPFISVSDIVKEDLVDNKPEEKIQESEEDKYNREMEEYKRRRDRFRSNPGDQGPLRRPR
jgi:hypothetical protein